ncbi:MAG TPA: enoyl-CoA hydratase/isomerase family protein [Acidimicrobiales bacterium]|nr:enoyl-CoA hydratase/isomerase family protein [Acidimicrobiales bacterium]
MAYVDLERDGAVFVLRMVDDDNRFHADSVAEWHAAVDEVEASTGPAALVTTGTGKFYSNGFALEQIIEDGTIGAVIPEALRLFARFLRLPVYTVAALNGHAFAAGAMLAMTHDARVMRADRGFWCLPEADMGVPLAPGMTALIAARLPIATAHRAIMTAHRWGGEDAVTAGIVDEAVAEDQVLARAVELATARADTSREATTALRVGLYGDLIAVLEAGRIS